MFKLHENPLLLELTHNIAFFLAGGFAIHSIHPPIGTNQMDYFIIVVGWILIAAALFFVFATLPYKRLERLAQCIHQQAYPIIYPILLAVTLSEVDIVMISPFEISLFVAGSVLIGLFFMSSVANTAPIYQSDPRWLMILGIVLCLMVAPFLLLGASLCAIIILAIAGMAIVILAIVRFVRILGKWPPYRSINRVN
jgi:hypothetical protein